MERILYLSILSILLNFLIHTIGSSQTIVKLKNGNELIGLEQETIFSSKKFLEFRGIPYAKAQRFKAPVKYDEKWEEPKKSTKYGNSCPQDDIMNESSVEGDVEEIVKPMGDEDCLFLNIATPSLNPEKPHPVLVWIHGGSFLYENGDSYGPHKFLEHEVILVTFNFRLGVLGFLKTDLIEGNLGLKDQSMALAWVKENIASFGGNSSSITLSGVNSGASSAHLHLLSPMSEGLFDKVFLQSGTAISPWLLQRNVEKMKDKFLFWLDCNTTEEESLSASQHNCLMTKDIDTLLRKQTRLTEWFIDPLMPIGPSIEKGDENGATFLQDDPYEILKSGKYWGKNVPIIVGVNSHEGLLHSWDIAHHPILAQTLSMEWHRALPITMMFRETALSFRNVSNSIFSFYFEDENTNKKDRRHIGQKFHKFEELTQMYSDRYFFIPVHKTAFIHGLHNKAPCYLYWFDYKGNQSTTQMSGYNDTIVGAAHSDQIQYLFNSPYFKEPEEEEDIKFGRKFLSGIVRFIQTGKPPAGGWVPITKEMIEGTVPFIYNRIGSSKDAFQLVEPFIERVKFWDKLPLLEYGKKKEDFPEFDEADNEEKPKETGPILTKEEIELLKAKLEL